MMLYVTERELRVKRGKLAKDILKAYPYLTWQQKACLFCQEQVNGG